MLTTEPDDKGQLVIDLSVAEECIQRSRVNYDRDGDNHYDNISAFIKSMRGTIRMRSFLSCQVLDAGEDPKFIARRIMICASEDVGNADPQALVVAVAASQGVEQNRNARSKNFIITGSSLCCQCTEKQCVYYGRR